MCDHSRVGDALVWPTTLACSGILRSLARHEHGEERWATFGLVEAVVLLVVIHTYLEQNGEEIIRIISTRKATRGERAHYQEGR